MVTGFGITTIGQVGEYLTVAELCRMGFIATTFTRNVPYFDILAVNEKNQTIPIQVKTIKGKTWQFDASRFLKIEVKNGKQEILGKQVLEKQDLIFVMVSLIERGKDEFFLLKLKDLQNIIYEGYSSYLEKHGGRRPNSPQSFHTAINRESLKNYKDNWILIGSQL